MFDFTAIPGWGGSQGPFPHQYGDPHVYARDVHSGAGNCVCGRHPESSSHVPMPSSPTGGWFGLAMLDDIARMDTDAV